MRSPWARQAGAGGEGNTQTTDSLAEFGTWSSASLGERVRPAAARRHCLLSRGFHCKAHTGQELGACSLDQAPFWKLPRGLCCPIISLTGPLVNLHPVEWEESPGGDGLKVEDMVSRSPHPSLLHGQPPSSLPFPPAPASSRQPFQP